MNDCECICCGEIVPEGIQVCPHCEMDLHWVECEHCGKEIIEDYALGDAHHLCDRCLEAELLPGKLVEFSAECEDFRSEGQRVFWDQADIPYFVAWILGKDTIRAVLRDEFERLRRAKGITLSDCEDFLGDDIGKSEYIDWLLEKEQKEKAGVTSTD